MMIDRPTLCAAPADAALMLELAPVPLLQISADGLLCWANPAAAALLGPAATAGQPLAGLWAPGTAASRLCQADVASTELPLPGAPPRWVCATSRPLPAGGWLLSLQTIDPQRAAEAEVARLEELLDLARDFGRLGVWERNVRTMEGRWDRQVRRFWGLDPGLPTPDFSGALTKLVEPDGKTLQAFFFDSMKRAGRYTMRFRVRADDGQQRWLHSQWLVKNGADGQPDRVLGLMMDDTEPFAMAQAANEAASQLALAVDLGNIAIWRHDLASDRMHYNRQAWEILGVEHREDGIPMSDVRALIHPDDMAQVLASIQTALATDRPVDVETRYRRTDGGWRTVVTRRVVQRDAAGQPLAFLGVGLDMTERLAELRHASEMTRRFELVTRTAGIGHWILEDGAERATWSEPLRAMFGLAPGAPVPTLAEWLAGCVHPDDREIVRQRFADWVRGKGESTELGFRVVRSDGQVRYLFTHSRVEPGSLSPLLFGVVIDLTEQRRSELALKSAQERAALAARGAGLGTWERDLDTDATYWDEQMWALRGRKPLARAMTEAERLECVHPDDRPRIGEAFHQMRAANSTVDHEFRVVWPDGQVRWIASRSVELHDGVSGTRRRIGVNWDITDSRTADAVRHEREIALRESQAKSDFLARMSHELRTPLNAVLGFSQLLLADETGTDAAAGSRRRRLDHIRAAGQHLLSLINDVLELASLEGGELRIALQPVALAPLVAQSLALLGPLQGDRQVTVHTGALGATVMADPTRLRQALLNLLSNAIKYNRDGGEVHIEALPSGTQVLLRVADSGRGMSDQQLRHLFEPFNRLGVDHEAIEGTGIGLAIVKALVERMGGTVQVQSSVGVGSVFELRLAAAGEVAATAAPAPAMPSARAALPAAGGAKPMTRRRLLYIEDNPVNALIIGELLARRSDLTLDIAVDGASGVAQAAALLPDLILLDMQLPDFDGFEVLRRLRAQPATATIPCIALSANAMPKDIERALQAGMSDYWTKPLDFKAFMASIDALFGTAP